MKNIREGFLKKITSLFDYFIIFFAYLVTNITAFAFIWQFPDFSDKTEAPWLFAGVSLCLLPLLILQIKALSLGGEIKNTLRKIKDLAPFIVFCFFTIIWSTYQLATIYELIQMVFATIFAIYISVRFKLKNTLTILLIYALFSMITSSLLIMFDPNLAKLNNRVFLGAWRGIFWHRNHFGSLMALFSCLFLLKLALDFHKKWLAFLWLAFFLISAILVWGSRSATGVLVFIILNGLLALLFIWLKYQKQLSKRHYAWLLVFFGGGLIVALFNLEFVFGLLGRNTTMTGRTPLWADLISRVWMERPFLGYGFGALWNQESFRMALTERHGWGYMIYFGDNGYLDILLNTGIIGFFLFLVFFVTTGVRSFRALWLNRDLISVLPLLLFVYVFWANISYSFFFEVDQFVWMLLVLSSVLSTQVLEPANKLPSKVNSPQP